jgi:lysophospholipase L1-like esterase
MVGVLATAQGRAAAQAAPAPAVAQPVPAPYSRDCQIGSTPIVEESSLPHVAAALQNRKQLKILAIGASPIMSRRVNSGQGETMRHLLKQAIQGLDVVMINRGVSGELSAQAAVRIKNEVALTEPDLVLWQVGTNDALAYVPLDEFENTVEDTLAWLKEHKVDVVLVGLQYVGQMALDDHYKAVRDLLRKIAAKENVIDRAPLRGAAVPGAGRERRRRPGARRVRAHRGRLHLPRPVYGPGHHARHFRPQVQSHDVAAVRCRAGACSVSRARAAAFRAAALIRN